MSIDDILSEILSEEEKKSFDDLSDKLSDPDNQKNTEEKKSWSMNEIDELLGIKKEDMPKKDEESSLETDEKTRVFSAPESTVVMELADTENGPTAGEPEEAAEEVSEDVPENAAIPESEKTIKIPDVQKNAIAQKTVGIRPIRNENLEHNIMTSKLEKSGGMETNEYRERFLNKPSQKLEKTSEYEKLHADDAKEAVERPGIIIKKSKFSKTADLEPIPIIIAAEDERNKSKPVQPDTPNDGVAGQIKLSGFGEEEKIEQIDEENAEEILKKKRDEKIREFKLNTAVESKEPEDEEVFDDTGYSNLASDYIDEEYTDISDTSKIKSLLNKTCRNALISTIAQAVLFLVSLIISIIVMKSGGSLATVGGSVAGNLVINLILLITCCMFGLSTIVRGFSGIYPYKPNASTGTVVVGLTSLLQIIATFIAANDSYIGVNLFTSAAIFAFTLDSLSRYVVVKRAKGNFAFVTSGTKLYTTERIDAKNDAFEIGRGLLIGDPDICYSAKTEFTSDFIDRSFINDPADRMAFVSVTAVFGISLIAAIISGIVMKDVISAFAVLAGICAIAMPAFTVISSNLPLLLSNRKFNQKGAAITGFSAVNNTADINAAVLDASDIFRKGSCSIIGIKTFHNMRIDDAILYTAAMTIEAGGPLGDIFSEVILGKKELLPNVESEAYEEKLGLSAWIHSRRILVGNRELLINHNVSVPDEEFEKRYMHDDRKIMYLAIAGKIAAMFVIKYKGDKHIEKCLKTFSKTGITMLIRSNDYNITEEMICDYFDLPLSAVKILSPVSGKIFDKYKKDTLGSSKAEVVHNGTVENFLMSLFESKRLGENIFVGNMISIVYSVLTIAIFAAIAFSSGLIGIGGWQVVLFQLVCGLIACAVPMLKGYYKD